MENPHASPHDPPKQTHPSTTRLLRECQLAIGPVLLLLAAACAALVLALVLHALTEKLPAPAPEEQALARAALVSRRATPG